MYKLLIVDDEPLMLVGIKSMIDYSAHNIEIIGTATNGQIALDIMAENMPDIILSDIKMPVMDGLEMMKNIREKYGDDSPLIVMLTSYEDFHMAKEALAFHAFDYLVKVDLTKDILHEVMDKVKEYLDNRESTSASGESADTRTASEHAFLDKFMISLINNLFESEEQFTLQAQELGISFDFSSYVCCYGEFSSSNAAAMDLSGQYSMYSSSLTMMSDLIQKYYPLRILALDSKHFAMVLFFEDAITSESKAYTDIRDVLTKVFTSIDNYYSVKITCGVGIPVNSPMSICDSYQYSRHAFRVTESEGSVKLPEINDSMGSHESFNISVFKKDLTKAFEEFDSELFMATIDNLCEVLGDNTQYFVQALDLASNLLYLSISLLPDGGNTLAEYYKDSKDSYLSLYRLTNVNQIIEWLTYYKKCIYEIFETHRKDYKNRIVTDVKKYINMHVKERLSLNEVAAIFGISPGYLSQLFGKYNETGFSEYVNICKINEAKILLKQDNLKVYEVANELSFGSEFYFSKVFKKVEGITPSEFLAK